MAVPNANDGYEHNGYLRIVTYSSPNHTVHRMAWYQFLQSVTSSSGLFTQVSKMVTYY
jgi:hypothetical protein